ncbi:MAG: 2-dehydropantoate 2-reductase [Candidatus Bathyarchaeia archaeon]
MSFKKIVVLGAGAIGSVYGALLSRRKDVTLIGRKPHVEAIKLNGLKVSGDINERFFVKAETEIEAIPSGTLILLTTKAHDTVEAIGKVKPLLKKDTVILVLQNGLGNEDLVKDVAGREVRVVRGLVTSAAEFLEAGKVVFWNGETIMEKNETSERIALVFNESGLKTRLVNDFEREVWNKLIVNCVINPLSAIFKVRDNMVGADSLKTVRRKIIQECVAVGKAEGIHFDPNIEECVEKKISSYSNFSSMCQDIMKGKKTEIDFLNGKIVELGKKHGIPTPVNEALVAMIKFLETKGK